MGEELVTLCSEMIELLNRKLIPKLTNDPVAFVGCCALKVYQS